MQNKTLKIDRAFFLLLVLIFLAGLLRTVFRPTEINEYENRYANQLAPLTAASYADGSFQDGMESALSDQVQFSQLAKKTYNFVTSYAAMPLIVPLENLTHGYVSAGDVSFYESKIVYVPWTSLQPEWLEPKAENLNAAIAAHPELEFYAYYIEKDTDIDFTTGQKIGVSEYKPFKLVPRLRIYPARRESGQDLALDTEHSHRMGAHRLLARRAVELHSLGSVLRSPAPVRKASVGRGAQEAALRRTMDLYDAARDHRLGAV